jgi:hypothetical protein
MDRLLDLSTGWMRYVVTQQRLDRAIQGHQMEWHMRAATRGSRPPTALEAQREIHHENAFLGKVADLVENETRQWIEEFQAVLRQIDQAAERGGKPAGPDSKSVPVQGSGAEAEPTPTAVPAAGNPGQ